MPTPLFEIRDLAKVYTHGRSRGPCAPARQPHARRRAVRRAARAVGLRQVDAAQHHRRPRRADERPGVLPRDGTDAGRRGGAHRLPAPPRRVRLPVLQPDSQPDRGRERRARHRDLRGSDDAGGGARLVDLGPRGRRTFRRSCRAASSSAWPSRAPSRSGPRCCCATSRPAPSISPPASSCSKRWRRSTPSWARRRSSSPTTPRSRRWPTA